MSETETSAVEAPAPDTNGVSAEIAAIMNFDPFESAPAEETAAPAGETQPTAPAEPMPPPAQEGSASPASPPVAAPDPLQQTLGALQQTVQQLPDAVAAAVKPQAPAQAQPEQDQWAPSVDGQPLNYAQVMSSIPEQVVNGLVSEHPAERKAALSQVLGVAMHVAHRLAYKQTVEQVRQEFSRVMPAFVQDQIRQHQHMQGVFNDFYGKYPELSNPSLRGVVQQEAVKLSQQLGVREWTPQFRDQLGEHVRGMLRGVAPAPVQTQATAAPTMGVSARPMNQRAPANMQQEIADLLF